MSKAGIAELLMEVGNENLEFQNLRESITDIKTVNGVSRVTFVTDSLTPNDVVMEIGKVALVVWMDAEDVTRARQKVLG